MTYIHTQTNKHLTNLKKLQSFNSYQKIKNKFKQRTAIFAMIIIIENDMK